MAVSASGLAGSLAASVGASFSGTTPAQEEVSSDEQVFYEFDKKFQSKIVALCVRDPVFSARTHSLIEPDHFEDAANGILVNLAQDYWAKYRQNPSVVVFSQIIKDAIKSGSIRKDLRDSVIVAFKQAMTSDLLDRDFITDEVAKFARHQAMIKAMIKATGLMDKGKYDEASDIIKKASSIGVDFDDEGYDFFEEIETRSAIRKATAAGVLAPKGISTGVRKLDEHLYHSGFGLEELTLLMGGAKSGKSAGLLFFARNAALAGHNTLYITMEMSSDIAASRIDASISKINMKELGVNIGLVEEEVKKSGKLAGKFQVIQKPGYWLSPKRLEAILVKYAAKGIRFSMIVLDYLDLCVPDVHSSSPIEDSKRIYVGFRAIAQTEKCALLSATQTNREGFKSVVAKAEHAADDFNKIRIADTTISINATDEEKAKNEARLYFAASRNEESGVTIHVKNDIGKMIFIESVIGVF